MTEKDVRVRRHIDASLEHNAMSQLTGRFVVADPQICHGEPTFRGTRILVRDVLEQVAMGLEWDTICQQWRHAITNDAIAEAVRLGGEALRNHPEELVTELAGK